MIENRSVDALDFVIFLLRWKRFFILSSITVFVLAYLAIYLFIPPLYESSSLILPAPQLELGEMSSLLKSFSGLPSGLSGLKKNSPTDMYRTIVYSRTTLDSVIDKFGLFEEYKLKSREKTIKELTSRLIADETKEGSYKVSILGSSPQQAADMANYIVALLNSTVINLNIQKSRDNRLFLEDRYRQVKEELKNAEDSMQLFQKKTGFYDVADQLKSTFEVFAKMESEIAVKEVELGVAKKVYGANTVQYAQAEEMLKLYQDKFAKLSSGASESQLLLSVPSIPGKTLLYYRLYRNIKIYNAMLEYIVPLYEQVKFEEQKGIPVLQVVDKAIPPEKRATPKRTLMAGVLTLLLLTFSILFLYTRERLRQTQNPKIVLLKKFLKF